MWASGPERGLLACDHCRDVGARRNGGANGIRLPKPSETFRLSNQDCIGYIPPKEEEEKHNKQQLTSRRGVLVSVKKRPSTWLGMPLL